MFTFETRVVNKNHISQGSPVNVIQLGESSEIRKLNKTQKYIQEYGFFDTSHNASFQFKRAQLSEKFILRYFHLWLKI